MSRKVTGSSAAASCRTMRCAVRGREPPVGVETHHEVAHRVGPHRVESGSCRERVEVVHHPGEIEVAERVEPVEEGLALVFEIALDGEVDAEAWFGFVELRFAPELLDWKPSSEV